MLRAAVRFASNRLTRTSLSWSANEINHGSEPNKCILYGHTHKRFLSQLPSTHHDIDSNSRLSTNGEIISLSKKGGKNARYSWDNASTMGLLKLVAEHRVASARIQRFKWEEIRNQFEKLVCIKISTRALQSKLNMEKKDYETWMKLKDNKTGISWDPTTGKLDAYASWWEMKIKENSDFKKFRDKGVPLALENLWKCVFGVTHAIKDLHVVSELGVAKSCNAGGEDTTSNSLEDTTSNSLEDAYDVLYRLVKVGLIERGTDLFCFAATKILDDRSRRGFMLMKSDADRISWLSYHLRENERRIPTTLLMASP